MGQLLLYAYDTAVLLRLEGLIFKRVLDYHDENILIFLVQTHYCLNESLFFI